MKKIIMIVGLVFVCVVSAYGAWEDITYGIGDDEFLSVAATPGGKALYLGTSNGLYRKEAGGEDWESVFVCHGENKGVTDIYAGSNDMVYIATRNGLYKSQDSGKKWKLIFKGSGYERECMTILAEPGKTGGLYLGTKKGLFFSTNSGIKWRKLYDILNDMQIKSIAMEKGNSVDFMFVIGNNDLYRIHIKTGYCERVFSIGSPADEGTEIDKYDEEDAFDGSTDCLNKIQCYNNILYLSTSRGVFISENSGSIWKRLGSSGLLSRFVNCVLVTAGADSIIVAATENGVFDYSLLSMTWSQLYMGMESKYVADIIDGNSERMYIALCKDRVYKMINHARSKDKEKSTAQEILSAFDNEPSIKEVHDMSIAYAEVYPGKIEKWRRAAKFKAFLPKLNFGIDHSMSDTYEIYTSSSSQYWTYGPQDNTDGWDINLSWDLSELIWNPDQTSIDVRSKLMVQLRDDIVDEVTRIYFERRRLQIDLLMNPPDDLQTALEKRLRVEELTAGIDGLTGGNFSRAIVSGKRL